MKGPATVIALLGVAVQGCAPDASPPEAELLAADSIVKSWVDSDRVPGAVLLVSREGDIDFLESYGEAAATTLQDGESAPRPLERPVPMTTSTVFDLASVTKVMATTMATMLLVDRGALDLDAPVTDYLADFSQSDASQTDPGVGLHMDKADITVRHLLTHRSGLSQWQPTYYWASSADAAFDWIRDLPLEWPVGEGRHYSDLGFMVLGRVIESVSGAGLDDFLAAELYTPLGLVSTGFNPDGTAHFAATSHGNPFERRMVHDPDFGYRIDVDPDSWSGWRDYTLAGEVNDGNAHHGFQGVAGHAGLFSTARELQILVQLLLNGGMLEGQRYMSSSVIDRFMRDTGEGQALGWQLPEYAPTGAFGHTGFTGTFVLGVPSSQTVVVLLTNRQNFGVDGATQYPDIGPLQRDVTEAITGR